MTGAIEVNFDGLVGPTHNYGGLSNGNLASMSNFGGTSNPKAAVLQGIEKMRSLMAMGLTQGVLPPHERPSIRTLRHFGFGGTDAEVIEKAWHVSPALLINTSSASAMWTANAATVSPSADCLDQKVHFTPANLGAMFHRSIEHEFTSRILRRIFADEDRFAHHEAIPYGGRMGDEGAANHGRFAAQHGDPGIELFVYGHSAFDRQKENDRFQARQALEASQGVASSHRLDPERTIFVQQSPEAINAGAFHNDVVSVTNGPALFFHEQAFHNKQGTLDAITRICEKIDLEPSFIEVPTDKVSLETAVKTYLFNSQLLTTPTGGMALILPTESEEDQATRTFIDECINNNSPITSAHYFDLKQSMKNGGGPACLRLRVALTDAELNAVAGCCIMTEDKITRLTKWAEKNYRDTLSPDDLRDPQLHLEANKALDELTQILELGSIYDFQQTEALPTNPDLLISNE